MFCGRRFFYRPVRRIKQHHEVLSRRTTCPPVDCCNTLVVLFLLGMVFESITYKNKLVHKIYNLYVITKVT